MPDDERDTVRPVWSEDELDAALNALRPGGPDTDVPALREARSELLAAAGWRERVEPRRSRHWAWRAAAAATIAAVMAGVLVVQTVQFGATAPSAMAVEQLHAAADRAVVADVPLAAGQYRYIATHAWWMSTSSANGRPYSYLAENLLETWVPADQTDVWLWRREETGARKWINTTEGEARAAGVPIDDAGQLEGEWQARCGDWFAAEEGREPCAREGSWQAPDAEFLAALPRGAGALHERLRADTEGVGSDPNLQLVVYVADALRTGLVPADLRAALYRVLAMVPGLEITEQVANLDGRTGTAYGMSANGTRHDVIVDPATGQFIGERQVAEKDRDGIPEGTVVEYTSMTTAVVDGLGVEPSG